MQPYFFPYIGYFQLMKAVDVFVFFDDVQYIDRGWVNRNWIRSGNDKRWLSFPVRKASQTDLINQREYVLGDAINHAKAQLHGAYAKAPHYTTAHSELLGLFDYENGNVSAFNSNLLARLARQIGIECDFLTSSLVSGKSELRGQAKIVDLCRRLGATSYVNAIGGIGLYDQRAFEAAGIELRFLRTTASPAMLASGPQHLSILDGLFIEGLNRVSSRMREFQLLTMEAS